MSDEATLEEAMEQLSRDERFKATIATINALLISKGIYTSEEFTRAFIEESRARKLRSPRSPDGAISTRYPFSVPDGESNG